MLSAQGGAHCDNMTSLEKPKILEISEGKALDSKGSGIGHYGPDALHFGPTGHVNLDVHQAFFPSLPLFEFCSCSNQYTVLTTSYFRFVIN